MHFYQNHFAFFEPNKSSLSTFWRNTINVIQSLHHDMANYTLLIQALFFIDLFSCTCLPLAHTSGASRPCVIASLG